MMNFLKKLKELFFGSKPIAILEEVLKIWKELQDFENRLHTVETKIGIVDPDTVKPKDFGTNL